MGVSGKRDRILACTASQPASPETGMWPRTTKASTPHFSARSRLWLNQSLLHHLLRRLHLDALCRSLKSNKMPYDMILNP